MRETCPRCPLRLWPAWCYAQATFGYGCTLVEAGREDYEALIVARTLGLPPPEPAGPAPVVRAKAKAKHPVAWDRAVLRCRHRHRLAEDRGCNCLGRCRLFLEPSNHVRHEDCLRCVTGGGPGPKLFDKSEAES